MGLINTQIELRNPLDSRLAPYEATALVDTGALHLCLPKHVVLQLQLPTVQQREVTTADGQRHICDYVGPVEVTFANRSCFVGALVLGDDVLLGAVPMEDLDLVISPGRQTVEVNPNSPNIPSSVVKSTS
ncbi:MAG: clan AA aspartic protease [Pirellulales bacterium]